MQELVEAEKSARAEVQARDQELAGARERQAELDARVKELVEAGEVARAEARDEFEQEHSVRVLWRRRVKELVEAEESAEAEAQARDQELAGARERQAELDARVQELFEAEEAAQADIRARDQNLEEARERQAELEARVQELGRGRA